MKPNEQKYFVEYAYVVEDDGIFPNSVLPVLHYKNVLDLPPLFPAAYIDNLFKSHQWQNSWKSGIYAYHHYHSTTHEVLGAYKGKTTLLLGGEKGVKVDFEKGDVLIIPAGVAHKNLGDEHDIACVGAYPEGKIYDMNYGKKEERAFAMNNIAEVPIPEKDPVLGLKGGLLKYWGQTQTG
jgi:uncharacterized protein YjlB